MRKLMGKRFDVLKIRNFLPAMALIARSTAALTLALASLSSLPAAAQVVLSTLTPPYVGSRLITADSTNHKVYMVAPPLNAKRPDPHRPSQPPYYPAQQGAVVILDSKSGAFSSILGFNPQFLAVNDTANKIYVGSASYPAVNGFPAVSSSLTILNGADNSQTTIAMSTPNAIVVDPVANKVYVSVADSNNDLVVIDGKTNAISATIPMPFLPNGLAVDTGLGKVYGYTYTNSNVISVNIATSAIKSIPTGGVGPISLVVDSQTHRAYAVDLNYNENFSTRGTICAIDTTTDHRLATRYAGFGPTAAAVNPNTKTVYVLNTTDPAFPLDPNIPGYFGPSMTVLDEATLTLLRPHAVPLVGAARNLAINPITNKIYVPTQTGSSPTLTVVDGNTNLPAAAYGGVAPNEIAIDPVVNQAYLFSFANTATNNVIVLDLTGGNLAAPTIFPASLKFSSPVGRSSPPSTIYLANTGGVPMTVTDFTYNATFIRQKQDCPSVLDPGAVCPIQLRFRPSAATPTYLTDTFQAAISTGATAATSIAADVPPLATSIALLGSYDYNDQLFVNGALTSADPDLVPDGGSITVTLNGVSSTGALASGGFAIPFDPSSLVPGQTYPVTLSFTGNAMYLPSMATGSITP